MWLLGVGILVAHVRGAKVDGLLRAVVGLGFVAEAVDGIRNSSVELRFSIWYGFNAKRQDRPVRFWLLTLINLVTGTWILIDEFFLTV